MASAYLFTLPEESRAQRGEGAGTLHSIRAEGFASSPLRKLAAARFRLSPGRVKVLALQRVTVVD